MLFFANADRLLSTTFLNHLSSLLQLTNTTSRAIYFAKHFDHCHVELLNIITIKYNITW